MSARLKVVVGLVSFLGALAQPLAQPAPVVPLSTIPGPADILHVDGDRAYLAAGKTLTLYDLSQPRAPRRLGAYSFPEKIWGFQVVDSLIYVAADFFGLGILDIGNPAAPTLAGSIKTPGQAKGVALIGTKALVADHMSGVDLIDVSNRAKPASLGSFFVDGYARDVAAVGSIGFAVDAPTGLYVFDLSKPGPFEAATTQQSATAPGSIVVSDAKASRATVAVLIGSGTVQVYDITNPLAPMRAATHRTAGRPLRATMLGTTAYVADGAAGVQVLDLSTPAHPTVVATLPTPKPARAVAVSDSLLLVTVGDLKIEMATREYVDDGEVLVLRRSSQP